MRAFLLSAAVLTAFAAAPSAAFDNASTARAVRSAGLMGRWAWECDYNASETNHWVTVAVGRDGVVATTETSGEWSSVYRLSSARRLANGDLVTRSTWDGDGRVHDITYRFRNGRQAIWSSVKLPDRVLVRNGVITGNGQPSRWYERCA